MANPSIIFTVGLVFIGLQVCQGDYEVKSCLEISDCFKYFEAATCDPHGRRQVCLSWVKFAGCPIAADSEIIAICKMNNFELAEDVDDGVDICDEALGGTVYNFGIKSKRHNEITSAGSISVNGYVGNSGMAVCDGFTSVCSAGGNNDFRLSFHVTPCPTTTTPTTTTPTTTTVTVPTQPGCSCTQWGQWGGCSATCGSAAQRTRTRTCSNCGNSNPPLSENGSCPNVPVNCPINGGWSNWGSFAGCTSTCGAGTDTRTRTCTMPPPQFGGSSCPGSDREVVACVLKPTCDNGGTGSGNGGGKRACKKRAKKGRCKGLKKQAKKRCIRRECD